MTYSLLVRDAIMTRLQAMSYFTSGGFHYSTNRALQIQPQSIPFCGVYLIEEINTPDGDANVGEPRFRQIARYGVSVIVQNNNADAAEDELTRAYGAINRIFNDPTLYNWSGDYGDAKIQAYMRNSRSHQFGSVGMENELPIAELRYDLTCDLGTITYEPDVPDTLNVVHVTTQFPSGGTQAEIDAVQQVQAHYVIWVMESSNLTITKPALGRPTLEIST